MSNHLRRLAAIPGAIGTLMLFGAQVGPDDAVKNLCKWPKIFFSTIPESCLEGINDFWYYVFAFGLLVLAFGWFFWPSKKLEIPQNGKAPVPYSEWRGLYQIDLETAAAIWAGTRDENDTLRHVRFRVLKEAVARGHLRAFQKFEGKINKYTTVKPKDLQAYFESPKSNLEFENYMEEEGLLTSQHDSPSRAPLLPDDFSPTVRIAGVSVLQNLFEGSDADKLIPLLESGKIAAWGRRMGAGHPPLISIPGAMWRTHTLWCVEDSHSTQTFFKTKNRGETIYYDVYLNRVQILRFWPDLDIPKK